MAGAAQVSGIKLSGLFYKRAVRPILRQYWPRLKYSAALIGYGSEVLGFDDVMSRDHEWGPRVRLFLEDQAARELGKTIYDVMAERLPRRFMGYPTHFARLKPDASNVLVDCPNGLLNHRAEVFGFRAYFLEQHAIDPETPLEAKDWLRVTQQSLLEITCGAVFHDGLGKLRRLRKRLAYYPRDVWLYLLACQWTRIGQEEPFVGRTGFVGDEVSSRVIAARLVRDVMQLCFLMERQYAPYSKWFGTAFARLKCARRMMPALQGALAAGDWQSREKHIVQACEIAARMHNTLRLTKPIVPAGRQFHDRPFTVIGAERFADALFMAIRDKGVKAIRAKIGAVDQFSDSTDLLDNPQLCAKLRSLWTT